MYIIQAGVLTCMVWRAWHVDVTGTLQCGIAEGKNCSIRPNGRLKGSRWMMPSSELNWRRLMIEKFRMNDPAASLNSFTYSALQMWLLVLIFYYCYLHQAAKRYCAHACLIVGWLVEVRSLSRCFFSWFQLPLHLAQTLIITKVRHC